MFVYGGSGGVDFVFRAFFCYAVEKWDKQLTVPQVTYHYLIQFCVSSVQFIFLAFISFKLVFPSLIASVVLFFTEITKMNCSPQVVHFIKSFQ